MKKSVSKNDRRILIIPVILILILAIGLIFMLNTARNIRLYKSTLCSLASGPYEVMAEYDGTTVKLRPDNQKKLLNYFAGSKFYAKGSKKPQGDVIHYYFKGDTEWTVDIYNVDKERVFIDVSGERDFSVAAENHGRFENYVKIGSPDGWDTINIIVDSKEK